MSLRVMQGCPTCRCKSCIYYSFWQREYFLRPPGMVYNYIFSWHHRNSLGFLHTSVHCRQRLPDIALNWYRYASDCCYNELYFDIRVYSIFIDSLNDGQLRRPIPYPRVPRNHSHWWWHMVIEAGRWNTDSYFNRLPRELRRLLLQRAHWASSELAYWRGRDALRDHRHKPSLAICTRCQRL